MKYYKNLIIIGGTGRNVGKTEFVCRLIEKVAAIHEVYALKVSAIFPDEGIFHGDHSDENLSTGQKLFEENRRDTTKDTSRMLRAGAKTVFYLRSDDSGILAGFADFQKQIIPDSLIVCESNSLWQFVKPCLLVMVTRKEQIIKPRAVRQMEAADIVVTSDGKNGFPEIEKIQVTNNSLWKLKK